MTTSLLLSKFYENMEDDQLGELARRKVKKGEFIMDMLDYLDYLDSDFIKTIIRELIS